MCVLILLCFVVQIAVAQLPPYLNCTRYLEPCVLKRGESCCGYPFYDCLSDGREALCQSISDFPEISAELLLRLREARDRGDPEAFQIRKDVFDLLGSTTRRPGGRQRGSARGGRRTTRRPSGRSRTTRRRTTPRNNE